jgi:hypothetical protein
MSRFRGRGLGRAGLALLTAAALVAAAGAWRLRRAPIALPFLAPWIERSIAELLPEIVARVGGAELAWVAHGPSIRVLDLQLTNRDGTQIASSPGLAIRPSLRALLHGKFAIARIHIARARLGLVRSAEGQITAGSARTGVFASLLAGSGRASPGYLSRITLADAQVTFDDRGLGETWLAEASQIDIQRHPARVVAQVRTRLTLQGGTSRILRDLVLPFSASASIQLDAAGRPVDAAIEARGDEGRIRLAGDMQAPMPLRSVRLQASFSGAAEALEVTAFEAISGPAHLKATGLWSTGSGALEFRGEIGSFRVEELPRLWPVRLAPNAREWVARNLGEGEVTAARFDLRSPASEAGGSGAAANEVEVNFAFTGLTVHYLRPLDPLRAVRGSAKLTATRFEAEVDGGSDGALSVQHGGMIVEFGGPEVPARVDVDVAGPTADLLAFLDRPPLGVPSRIGLPTAGAGGTSEVHAEIGFPLSRASTSPVKVTASADMQETTLPAIRYGVGVEQGRFEVRVDGDHVEIEGDTGLTGTTWVTEPLHVALSYEPAEGADRLRATFSGRDLNGEVEGTLDGETLRALSIVRLRYGRSDLSGHLARDRSDRLRVSISGETLDLAPFVARFGVEAPLEPAAGDPWDFDARFRRMLAGDLEFTDVTVHARGEGKGAREGSASGGVRGAGDFRLDLRPRDGDRRLDLSCSRGGELLKAFGIYDHAAGGQLSITASLDPPGAPGTIAGEIEMSDFRIAEAPILARVLSLASLDGIAGMLRGEGLAFSRARVPFTSSDGRFELRQATAVGAIGLTADGTLDRRADRIDLRGTIVPAYTLNSALGKLPLFGKFLVGGEGQGVFGIDYSVGGTLQQPDVKVNVLSALAPGALRKMFVDPFTKE